MAQDVRVDAGEAEHMPQFMSDHSQQIDVSISRTARDRLDFVGASDLREGGIRGRGGIGVPAVALGGLIDPDDVPRGQPEEPPRQVG